jgi:hypothetical protein
VDVGWVAGEVLADDVQAEGPQDRRGGFVFQEELERGPDKFFGGNLTASEAGGKSGRNAHVVAGASGRLDIEGAIGLTSDGDLRHAATLASRHTAAGWR